MAGRRLAPGERGAPGIVRLQAGARRALRAAAASTEGPLTTTAYRRWAAEQPDSVPSSNQLGPRGARWADLLAAAGLEATGYQEWSDDEILAALGRFLAAGEGDARLAHYRRWRVDQVPPAPGHEVIVRRFGSWPAATQAAWPAGPLGHLAVNPGRRWSDDECLDALGAFLGWSKGDDRIDTYRHWRLTVAEHRRPGADTIAARFGGWRRAVEGAARSRTPKSIRAC